MTYSKYTYIRMFVNKFPAILNYFHSPFHQVQIYFILINIYYDLLQMILHPLLTPSLSVVWVPKFGHCRPNPILFLPRNHAFTIKTSASYLEKSLSTSKLLISALEIHQHFVAFSCPPFCSIFSKPTLTVSFEKYRLSIIFSLITS